MYIWMCRVEFWSYAYNYAFDFNVLCIISINCMNLLNFVHMWRWELHSCTTHGLVSAASPACNAQFILRMTFGPELGFVYVWFFITWQAKVCVDSLLDYIVVIHSFKRLLQQIMGIANSLLIRRLTCRESINNWWSYIFHINLTLMKFHFRSVDKDLAH